MYIKHTLAFYEILRLIYDSTIFFMRHNSCIEQFERKKLFFKCSNKMIIIIMPITNARFNKILQY